MITLLIIIPVAICIFGVAFYQSYRDKQRWKRISSGMSLFGDRQDIPKLVVDGVPLESNDRPVQLIWGDKKRSGFETVFDARQRLERAEQSGKAAARGARIFAWDGEGWVQRK